MLSYSPATLLDSSGPYCLMSDAFLQFSIDKLYSFTPINWYEEA